MVSQNSLFLSLCITQRRGHMSIQWDGLPTSQEKKPQNETYFVSTSMLDFPASRMLRNKVLLSHLVCGILLWQPELTKIPCLAWNTQDPFLGVVLIAALLGARRRKSWWGSSHGFCHTQLIYDWERDFYLLFRNDQGVWPLWLCNITFWDKYI